MPCIQRLKHIHSFTATHLSYDYPVRSHTQGSLDQVSDSHRCSTLGVGHFCFQAYQIVNPLNPKLRIVLHCNQPFVRWDILGQSSQECSLPASCSPADHHGISGLYQLFQKISTAFGNTSKRNQLFHGNRMFRKTAYGQ